MAKSVYKETQERICRDKYERIRKQLPDFAITWLNSKPNLTWSSKVAYADDLLRYFKYVIDSVDGISVSDTRCLCLEDIYDEGQYRLYDDDFFNAYASYLREYCEGFCRGNNRNSVERKLVPLRGLYLYYSNRGDIKLNPMANYPRYKEPERKNIIRLNDKEVHELIDVVKHGRGLGLSDQEKKFRDKTRLRDYAIVMLLLGTGIRVSELVGADIHNLNLRDNCLSVIRKGEHEDQVYFNEKVASALRDYIEAERPMIKVKTDEEPLFYSLQGKRISVDAVENRLKKYAGAITNKHVSAHLFRKTYGTALYKASGGDLALVQDALGHASPVTTKAFYIDSHDANMVKAGKTELF